MTTVDGETLFIPNIRELHRSWHTAQTELDPPPEGWFGRDISNNSNDSETDSRNRELLNYTGSTHHPRISQICWSLTSTRVEQRGPAHGFRQPQPR